MAEISEQSYPVDVPEDVHRVEAALRNCPLYHRTNLVHNVLFVGGEIGKQRNFLSLDNGKALVFGEQDF